jgi:hypothetical protein
MPIQDAVFTVVQDLVMLALAIAVPIATGWLYSHFTTQQLAIGRSIAYTAVHAVEQVAAALGIKGDQKLAEALNRVKTLAARVPFLRFTDAQWDSLIHEAVDAMNQWKKQPQLGDPTPGPLPTEQPTEAGKIADAPPPARVCDGCNNFTPNPDHPDACATQDELCPIPLVRADLPK